MEGLNWAKWKLFCSLLYLGKYKALRISLEYLLKTLYISDNIGTFKSLLTFSELQST